jgi:DNA invertase Pin-like site-specific DNA recombinase
VLRAILYLRISDLTDTSTSIPRQHKRCTGAAENIRAQVVNVHKDEDKSGYHTYVERPGWDAALADLRERRADVLIVFKVDRATRQGIPQAAEIIRVVYETGCRFISVMDGIDSDNEGWELQLTIAAHQAHRESKNTGTRVADLRAEERDAGRWMGNRPYGFVVTPERKLEPHPEESKLIRKMVARLLDGKSLRSVALWLNEEGHDSPRWASRKQRIDQLEAKGEPLKARRLREKPMKTPNSWTWSSVRQLVTSPVMTGYMPHKGEIYRHSETGEMVRVGPEILSLDEHVRLRAMVGARVPIHWTRSAVPASKSKDTGRAVTALLTDVLHCGACGARMKYDTTLIRKGKPWPRYRCVRRAMGGRCPGVLMKAESADFLVKRAMVTRLGALDDDDPALASIAERWTAVKHPDRAARRATLEAMINQEEHYLDRLEDEKLNGLFQGARGEARFRRRYSESNGRLETYEKELAELPADQPLDIGFLRDTEQLEALWDDVWTFAEKRETLGLALNRAWVFKARAVGVRPNIDRFRFWWVGEDEPQDIGASLSITGE